MQRFIRGRIVSSQSVRLAGEAPPSSQVKRVSAGSWRVLVLSGLTFYTALAWTHPAQFIRLLTTLGPGVLCVVVAIVLASNKGNYKAITALIILSALLLPAGLFLAAKGSAPCGGDMSNAAPAVFGVLAIQYGILFIRLKRRLLLWLAVCFALAAAMSVVVLTRMPDEWSKSSAELECPPMPDTWRLVSPNGHDHWNLNAIPQGSLPPLLTLRLYVSVTMPVPWVQGVG